MDDEICMVGSANQDIRSYRLNFETSAVIYDADFLNQLADQFLVDEEKMYTDDN